jgi:hypothetical protein
MNSNVESLRKLGGKLNSSLSHNEMMRDLGRWARPPMGTWAGEQELRDLESVASRSVR